MRDLALLPPRPRMTRGTCGRMNGSSPEVDRLAGKPVHNPISAWLAAAPAAQSQLEKK